ncbi:MAG: tRNA (adenosine(37)-N6)-threonylcarbamoyltransferase complex ATPase subunit type 1 TsaE [Oscillospiraceae bacterium]|nr:tRNA (adenosine(37)-N6)-threonylcarbamoyltransferase complex ATPase subunit type 1 TsaE [Oscillospiraceae bacterium]
MTISSRCEADTRRAGYELGKRCLPGTVIALSGDLGAGKTAFVRGLAEALGCRGRVTSPTFTIVNEYPGTLPLFHFDMYRLSGPDDLFEIGWEDYLERGGVCAVEWSELIPDAFPPDTVRVAIVKTGGDTREITITFPGGGDS